MCSLWYLILQTHSNTLTAFLSLILSISLSIAISVPVRPTPALHTKHTTVTHTLPG